MKYKKTLATTWLTLTLLSTVASGGNPELPLNLGSAGDFVVLAEAGIDSASAVSIKGDIGVSPIAATAITGFSLIMDMSGTFSTSAQVTGKVYASDYAPPTPVKMTTAISDMHTAYTTAAGRTLPDATELASGNISGLTITPGLYKWSTGVLATTDVWLDALGNPDAVFIFQISGDLNVMSGAKVLLAGGAQAKNIFWQVGGVTGARVFTGAHVEGVIMTAKLIDIQSGASFNGKLFAQTAVTLNDNIIVDSDLVPSQFSLDIISEHGIASPTTGRYVHVSGTLLTNSVTDTETLLGGTQYVNTGWSMIGNDEISGLTNSMTMTITNNAVLTWQWNTNYLLSLTATNGSILNATNGWKLANSTNELSVLADPGYAFDHWELNGVTNGSVVPLSVLMDEPKNVVAIFAPFGGTNLSFEIISEHGIGSPTTGLYSYVTGTLLTNSVTDTETLLGGTQYVNTGWSMIGNDEISGLTNSMTMTITNNAVLTWQWSTNYLLSLTATNGSILNATNGWKLANSTNELSVLADPGYAFDHWEINGVTNGAVVPLSVTMDEAKNVVAIFAPFAGTNLSFEIISEHGIGSPTTGLYSYVTGTLLTNSVTDTETLLGGTQYVNTGWSMIGNDEISGLTNSMTMTITNNAVLTWQWSTNYFLSLTATNGSILNATNGWYLAGSTNNLTVLADLGYTFDHWELNGVTNGAVVPLSVTMDEAKNVVAIFAPFAGTNLSFEIISEHGIGSPTTGLYSHVTGTLLTNSISATETMGGTQYVNTGWSMVGNDEISGLTNSMTMTITNNAVLTWQWSTNYFLALTATNGLILNTAEGWKPANSNYEVTVQADPGFTFDHWELNGVPIGAGLPLSFTMDEPKNYVAVFSSLMIDISSNVDWNASWVFDPRKGYFIGTVTITHTNAFKVLVAPFWFQVESTTNHWLRMPTGINPDTGFHYLDITASVNTQLLVTGNGDLVLDVGESVTVTGIELMGRRTPAGLVIAVWADPPGKFVKPVDTDGDGMSDADEYIAGSSAVDPASAFLIRLAPNGRSVEWDGKPNRNYTVLISTNLSNGFVVDGEKIKSTNKTMTHPAVPSEADTGSSGTHFFRVNVDMQ